MKRPEEKIWKSRPTSSMSASWIARETAVQAPSVHIVGEGAARRLVARDTGVRVIAGGCGLLAAVGLGIVALYSVGDAAVISAIVATAIAIVALLLAGHCGEVVIDSAGVTTRRSLFWMPWKSTHIPIGVIDGTRIALVPDHDQESQRTTLVHWLHLKHEGNREMPLAWCYERRDLDAMAEFVGEMMAGGAEE